VTGPYEASAWTYRRAGWAGVLPLPPGAKWPPPGGYTGWAGVDPSGPDVQAWIDGAQGAGNVALRLPSGVYGLDVDNYGGKTGGAALARLVDELGALPATWVATSRDDGVSGIRLFRAALPIGRRWRDEPAGHGAGVEAIHLGHRYAVVWPSLHPDTGRKYRWCRADGLAADGEVPELAALPELPAVWIEALSEVGEVRTGEMAGHAETVETVSAWRDGEACPRTAEACARALRGLREALDGAALHPVSVAGVHELVNLGHEGHIGVRRALAEHYALHVEVRRARGDTSGAAEGEWWRAVRGAIGKLPGTAIAECDCGLWAGDGLTFTPIDLGITYGAVGGTGGGDLFSGPAVAVLDSPAAGTEAAAGPNGANGQGADGAVVEADLIAALDAKVLTAAEMRELPPPVQLVEGLLCLDSESWLIAKSSSYKTFVALDLAGHVAAGRPWMGRAVIRGPVFYLVAEGVGGMPQRVRAWEQRNGPMADVAFLPMPVQVKQHEHWAALVEVCRRRAPRLVILDTQARITVGLDENDNSEMGQMVEAIGRLRRATGACVLIVHHLGRSGQDARGASAIDAAQDSELRLTRTADLRVVLESDKQRHLADDARIELELFTCELDDGGTSLVVGPPIGGPAVTMPDHLANLPLNQRVLADLMREIFPMHGATKAELKAEARKRVRIDPAGLALEPMPDSSFRRAWDDLLEAGRLIRVDGMERYVLESTLTAVNG
jgi:hypothetical protein